MMIQHTAPRTAAPQTRLAPPATGKAGEMALFEVQDKFMQNYDEAMAGYIKTGLYSAQYDSKPEKQTNLRTAILTAVSSLSGVTAQAVAATALASIKVLESEDPSENGDIGAAGRTIQSGHAPSAAVLLAAFQTVEELPAQSHPHAKTLARFGRELSQELEPESWNVKGDNLYNGYACKSALNLAKQAVNEIANLDDSDAQPALGESVSRAVLGSFISDWKAQNLALDKGFQLIYGDKDRGGLRSDSDKSKAYAGLNTTVESSHSWIPFLKVTDQCNTAEAKTAIMQNLLHDHGVDVRFPFH